MSLVGVFGRLVVVLVCRLELLDYPAPFELRIDELPLIADEVCSPFHYFVLEAKIR